MAANPNKNVEKPAEVCVRFTRNLRTAFQGNRLQEYLLSTFRFDPNLLSFSECFDDEGFYKPSAGPNCHGMNEHLLCWLDSTVGKRMIRLLNAIVGRASTLWNANENVEEHAILLWWMNKLTDDELRGFLSPFFAAGLMGLIKAEAARLQDYLRQLNQSLRILQAEKQECWDQGDVGTWQEIEARLQNTELEVVSASRQSNHVSRMMAELEEIERSTWLLRLSTTIPKAMSLWNRDKAEYWLVCLDPNTILKLDLHNLRGEPSWKVSLIIGQAPQNLTMAQLLQTAKPANVPVLKWLSEEAFFELFAKGSTTLDLSVVRALYRIHHRFLLGEKVSILSQVVTKDDVLRKLVNKEYLLASPAHPHCFQERVKFIAVANLAARRKLCEAISAVHEGKSHAETFMILLDRLPKPSGAVYSVEIQAAIMKKLPRLPADKILDMVLKLMKLKKRK